MLKLEVERLQMLSELQCTTVEVLQNALVRLL